MVNAVSGDKVSIHYNVYFCKKKNHRYMPSLNFQIISQDAAGVCSFPNGIKESLIGIIKVSKKFLNSVYKNDTTYPGL